MHYSYMLCFESFFLPNESLDESEVVLEDMEDGFVCQHDEREAI